MDFKKNIYHSNLVQAGPTEMVFTSKVNQNDKGKYVKVKVGGADHFLTVENDTVGNEISKYPMNAAVRVTASGARDKAVLKVEPLDAASTPLPPVTDMPSLADDLMECLDITLKIVPIDLTEAQQKILTTLFMERQKNPRRRLNGEAPEAEKPVIPNVVGETRREDTDVEKKSFFLHRRFSGGKHEGKNWIEVAELDDGYINWAVTSLKSLTDEQRQWLTELEEERLDPFAEQAIVGSDGKPLF
jgi:hypothetical protein